MLISMLLCAAAAAPEPLVALIREVTSDVEQLRGLKRKQSLKVQILDDKLFSQAVRERAQKDLSPAVVAAERARWTAFALAPAGADPGRILLSVLDEQVAGFYDPFTKQLIVRKDLPDAAGQSGEGLLRVVLAHEIEHALQDQNFGIPDPKTLPDDDTRLARSALFEGDAMAVMNAYAARRAHRPVKAAIIGGAAMLRALDVEALLRLSGKSPALSSAPAILREELVLPYSAGYALVAEVYRRGGFALVDRMFKNPPLSSHQILHPEAYFAGEVPISVPAPPAPPGTRVVSTGRMGELGARIALEVCVDPAVVKEFARRWAGDAYTIVEGADHARSLLWTSAWTGDAAPRVANLMGLEQPCWDDSAMPGPSKMLAAGSLVALARGNVDLDVAVSKQLTAHAVGSRPAPPLGDVPPPAAPEPARIVNGEFEVPRLSLRGAVPDGFVEDATRPAAELSIVRPHVGSASLSFLPEPLAGDALETFFERASSQIATSQEAHLSFVGSSQRKLAGASAEERSWAFESGTTKLRIDVARWCGGKAAVALIRIETGASARDALEQFAGSMKVAPGVPPACAEME